MATVIPSLMVLLITAMATKIIAIVTKPNMEPHTAMTIPMDTGTCIPMVSVAEHLQRASLQTRCTR